MKRIFDGKNSRLCINQYGVKIWAKTLKELREQSEGGRVSKMYQDKKDGSVVHVGYVIGPHWFSVFAPVEIPE
jgi:hypothetical protein